MMSEFQALVPWNRRDHSLEVVFRVTFEVDSAQPEAPLIRRHIGIEEITEHDETGWILRRRLAIQPSERSYWANRFWAFYQSNFCRFRDLVHEECGREVMGC